MVEGWKFIWERREEGGGRGGVEKGGGSGCCNTATYSTGEGSHGCGWREGKEVKGGKGKRRKEGGERKKGGGGGCCNTATYSTGEGGAAMEREG